jgi:ssDNA-binding Zn-finger/Zn-ribbon topoisomerase 1
MTEHKHEFEEVGIEISKDGSALKCWASCKLCGKGVFNIKPNGWKGEDLDRKCPKCGKHLVRFSKLKKADRSDHYTWNAVSPDKISFISCSGRPDCDYQEHN